jgi:hypothetical protein
MYASAHYLCPPDDGKDDGPEGTQKTSGGFPTQGDDLAYKVEVWDETGKFVEQVVAVSATPAIGYAAYYAAAREYPGRSITLRHRKAIVSRWTGHAH